MKHVNIEKYSETIKKIQLTDKERKLITNLLLEMSQLNQRLENIVEISKNALLIPLLLLEGESTSLIEGTRSIFEDFSYDIEEMNNIPQWETRNLICLYEKYLLDEYYFQHFHLSLGMIQNMHIDLFKYDLNSKFKMIFDPSKRIEQVKPGKILSNDNKPNFIGCSNDINKANLILLKPSLKEEFLKDLLSTIDNQLKEDSLLIEHLIISHPIFEAIHPFVDGNGRLGRLLLNILFRKMYKGIKIPLFLSEEIYNQKEIYKEKLFNVQSNNDSKSWSEWITFFIDILINAKNKLSYRITKIIKLIEKVNQTKAFSTEVRKNITETFFKYYKVNKNLTIKNLQRKFPHLSIQTLYKDFNLVTKILGVENIGHDYWVFNDLLKIIRLK